MISVLMPNRLAVIHELCMHSCPQADGSGRGLLPFHVQYSFERCRGLVQGARASRDVLVAREEGGVDLVSSVRLPQLRHEPLERSDAVTDLAQLVDDPCVSYVDG